MASRARGKRAETAAPSPARARQRTGRSARLVEALRAHEHRTAAGLFALFVLVYLWPALVGGDVLSPAALLYAFPPWNAIAPPERFAFTSSLLTDVPTSYYAWDVLGRELLHSGTFPAWNPHAFAGTPLFGNLSVAWLSPFSLPLWLLPLNYALGLAAALKLWVAAFGTYLLVRELRLGFWAGLVAGVSFTLCAFNVVWLTHGAHVSVAVLLPWMIWLTERIVKRGGRREGVALAIVVACALAGGHPGTQVHVLAGTLLYALVRSATMTEVVWSERLRRLAAVGGGMAVGALLMAVVLLPGERAAVDTVGAAARRTGGSISLIGGTLSLETLRAALFPDWWGRPSEIASAGPANYNERAFYAGGVTLVLALVALVSPGAWRRKAAFLPLLALGLLVPLGVAPFHTLVVNLPIFERVQNQRLLLWFAFAVALLGAFGLQAILDAPRRQLRAWAVVALAAAVGLLVARSIELAPGDASGAVDHLTDRFAGLSAGALALASVLRWLLLVLVVAAALLLVRLRPRQVWLAGGLVALLAALDMLLFANAYQPIGPASVVLPPRTPAIAFLQDHADDGRIAGYNNALINDWSTIYGLRDARGYDAPQPSRRFYDLWRSVSPVQDEWRPFDVKELSPQSIAALSVLGTRYVVTGPGVAPPTGADLPDVSVAYRGQDAIVLENARAAPRALVAEQVRVAGETNEEVAIATSAAFDPRREAIVRSDEAGSAPPAGATGEVRVVSEENARVTLRARLDQPGLVVLSDAFAPGWSVTVDGEPQQALEANVVMRGVAVPAGEHEIVWSYRVPGLRLGALLSVLGLFALLAWAGWPRVQRWRAAR